MANRPPADTDDTGSARMKLERKAIHEQDDGIAIDCPKCGSLVTVTQIVNQGRCPGTLEEGDTETQGETKMPDCNAKLALELVWEE